MLMARWVCVFSRSAFTLVGANGSSITLNRAERVSLPPGEVTMQEYWPTSDARTALISKVPSALKTIRWLFVIILWKN